MDKEKLDEANRLNNRIVELEKSIEFLTEGGIVTIETIEVESPKNSNRLTLYFSTPEDIERIKDKLELLLEEYQIEFKDLKC